MRPGRALRVRSRCRCCHRYPISRPLQACPSYRRYHRSAARYSPSSCIQARARLICAAFRAWHNYSRDITHTADDTRSVGVKVNEHWSTGDKAANNIINHAKWLDAAAASAERLSVAAEAAAHAFDIAKQDTPTPDEFADAESDVMKAAALMAVSPAIGMIEYQQATSRYADLVAKAEEAAKQYHASVSAALTGVGNPIVPCPPITSKADIPNIPLGPGVKIPETAPKSITGYTKHAEDRIAGRDGGIGVRRDALEDAFNHPVRDVKRLVDDQGRVSYQYTGENATVVVN